ncbi:MAG: hypothetical protein KZQ99_08445 [Candidatus Thiodiazotropha sp. (ex Dulcina madagascariensis)]|nr:hypothetical protein [Candidatus Thiodiazotropha sp. (ex Dulcina madagascariensis)]
MLDLLAASFSRVSSEYRMPSEQQTSRYRVATSFRRMPESRESAIQREKAIKNWKRAWKIKTIEAMNPCWRDLHPDLI